MRYHAKLFIGAIGVLFLLSGTCDNPNPVDNDDSDPKPSFGSFQVSLVVPDGTSPGYTAVFGRVNDGPTPSGIIWEQAAAVGICRLLKPRLPFCPEPCGGNAICVEGDSCQAYPSAIYAGKVTVNGLKANDGKTTFTMDSSRGNYQPVGIIFSYPPFSEGGTISLIAAGSSSFPACTLSVKGISPLEVLSDSIVLENDKPVTLRWTPATVANNSTVLVKVDISHHGGTAGIIECKCPDDGSVTIPASLINQLKALGYFGFPKIEFTRRSVARDSATGVELAIESMVTKYVNIPGLRSCNENSDCDPGEICEYFRCKDTTANK